MPGTLLVTGAAVRHAQSLLGQAQPGAIAASQGMRAEVRSAGYAHLLCAPGASLSAEVNLQHGARLCAVSSSLCGLP